MWLPLFRHHVSAPKTRYKYDVCRQQYIKITQLRSRDFCKEVCKMSKSRKATAPVIDNQSADDDIPTLFSTQLKGVLNS